jgi:hypothetical protein
LEVGGVAGTEAASGSSSNRDCGNACGYKHEPCGFASPSSLLRNRQKLFKNNEKQQQADRLENRSKAQYMVVHKKITTI